MCKKLDFYGNIMGTLRYILLSLILLSCTPKPNAELIRVVDGDTLQVLYQGKKEKVRLLYVNTPESVHPDKSKNTEAGHIAKRALQDKLLNVRKIRLEFDKTERDRYQRLLAYVWVGKEMINLWLIENGYSEYYTKYGESSKHSKRFRSLNK